MKKLILMAALMLAVAVPAMAGTVTQAQQAFHDFVTFGVGTRWNHSAVDSQLVRDPNLWLAAKVTIPFNSKVSAIGTFERDAVDQPIYSVRAGVWIKL